MDGATARDPFDVFDSVPDGGASASVGRVHAAFFAAGALMAVVWASSALFGLYIVAFYGRAVFVGEPERWNNVLPGMYGAQEPQRIDRRRDVLFYALLLVAGDYRSDTRRLILCVGALAVWAMQAP